MNMKRHSFLQTDFQTSVKLSPSEERQLKKWLDIAGVVLTELFKNKIIKAKDLKNLQVSLLICGDSRIKQLNNEFRSKNKITDVLSFPAHENLRDTPYNEQSLFLGDLAICFPQTKRQAKEFSIPVMDEFIHLFFHGVIHLLGYDHEISFKEEKLMEKWESEALDLFSKIKNKTKKKAP